MGIYCLISYFKHCYTARYKSILYIKDFVHLAMQFAFTYAKLFNLFLTQVEVKHSMGKERKPCASHWLEFQ